MLLAQWDSQEDGLQVDFVGPSFHLKEEPAKNAARAEKQKPASEMENEGDCQDNIF